MSKATTSILVALIVWQGVAISNAWADRPAKPNILLLLTDDLGWQDVKCYDIDEPCPYETPNIDALSKKGVMFWQGYSPTPVCASTRCSILSGVHAARAQKTSVRGGTPPEPLSPKSRMIAPWQRYGLPPNELTLPKVLQQNGYVTGHVGKWHISKGGERDAANRTPFGFSFSRCDRGSTKSMPDRLTGFATQAADDPFRLDANGYPFHQNNEDALAFLRENKEQPFFLYYATWLVHSPIHTRSQAHLQKYVERLGTDPANTPLKDTPGQNNPFYASMVQELDYYVGQVFDYLEKTDDPRWPGHKLSENTFVIFTSDNGGMEGSPAERFTDNRPLLRGKISAMEGGTRVPLIITGPEIPRGVQTNVMANGLDFYPTILSMAGIDMPKNKIIDGCDLTPLLLNDVTNRELVKHADGSVRDTMVWHFPVGVAMESTIRVGDYKLVHNYDHLNNSQTNEFELYRLYETLEGNSKRVDIEEANNLASSMPDKTRELAGKLKAILTQMNTTYPTYNPSSVANLPDAKTVPSVDSYVLKGNTVEFSVKENGSKLVRADLIYTTNGGNRDEEWLRSEANIDSPGIVVAKLPEGTTHFYLNLIDEKNFLVCYPAIEKSKRSHTNGALTPASVNAKLPKKKTGVLPAKPSKKFIQLDADEDGKVSEAEYLKRFKKAFESKDKNNDGLLDSQEHSHASFARADQDGNERLTNEEFMSIHRRHFTNADKNNSGFLTPEEMVPVKKDR